MLAVALPAEVRSGSEPWADRLWRGRAQRPGQLGGRRASGRAGRVRRPRAATTVRVRRIAVDYASHTPHVEALRERTADASWPASRPRADRRRLLLHRRPASSSTPPSWTPSTGTGNLRNPVRFEQAVAALAERAPPLFIEVSPHPVLGHRHRGHAATGGRHRGAAGTLRRDDGGLAPLRSPSLAQACVPASAVDWATRLRPATHPAWTCRRTPSSGSGTGSIGGDPAGLPGAGSAARGHPLLDAGRARLAGRRVRAHRAAVAAAPALAGRPRRGRRACCCPAPPSSSWPCEAGDEAGCDAAGGADPRGAAAVLPEQARSRCRSPSDPPDARAAADRRPLPRRGRRGRRLDPARPGCTGDGRWRVARGSWPLRGVAAGGGDGGRSGRTVTSGWRSRAMRTVRPSKGFAAVWRRGDEVFAEVARRTVWTSDRFGVHPALLDAAFQPARAGAGRTTRCGCRSPSETSGCTPPGRHAARPAPTAGDGPRRRGRRRDRHARPVHRVLVRGPARLTSHPSTAAEPRLPPHGWTGSGPAGARPGIGRPSPGCRFAVRRGASDVVVVT